MLSEGPRACSIPSHPSPSISAHPLLAHPPLTKQAVLPRVPLPAPTATIPVNVTAPLCVTARKTQVFLSYFYHLHPRLSSGGSSSSSSSSSSAGKLVEGPLLPRRGSLDNPAVIATLLLLGIIMLLGLFPSYITDSLN